MCVCVNDKNEAGNTCLDFLVTQERDLGALVWQLVEEFGPVSVDALSNALGWARQRGNGGMTAYLGQRLSLHLRRGA